MEIPLQSSTVRMRRGQRGQIGGRSYRKGKMSEVSTHDRITPIITDTGSLGLE